MLVQEVSEVRGGWVVEGFAADENFDLDYLLDGKPVECFGGCAVQDAIAVAKS